MEKKDVLMAIRAEMDAAENESKDKALSDAYDAGIAAAPVKEGFTQADLDDAVAKATADDHVHMKEMADKMALEEDQMAQVKATAAAAIQQALAILGVQPKPE